MTKKTKYVLATVIIASFFSTGFKSLDNFDLDTNTVEGFYIDDSEVFEPTVATEKVETEKTFFKLPYTGKSFIAFKEAVAFKESMGLYHLINSYGYMGKYQFGKTTLKGVGINDSSEFLKSPELQEKAFRALVSRNKWELRNEIKRYNGKVIGGVKITESGLIAAAHLGGAGSVKKFLRTGEVFHDGYGTSIKSYLQRFADYDTSGIVANKNAKVKV
ncbi:peptidoglycan-binding protein LysM [Flavobacterium agricola]|uniref:Peptidoglycan-binding protein LysM n=1 Tax=Flavobacterium agricola TaxID=2870839 RepID=A0ABY6M198_9FLAO|nr:peptidoglycan-binding protein LysM [Flavobacterium agricola]UYW01434.1 peptidoglycan-binding protein LysM [Flavobacterium agricola]